MESRRSVLLVAALLCASAAHAKRPHIVVILADDLGWNDVSFHGSDQIPTPNIDALAYNGVILNQHYVPALCTPSRAALMTGKYPTHTGMQHIVILEPEPWGLPLEEKLLPEYLSELGYRTHAVGKWHLGYHRREYTPTHRGFDSHFGYWNGFQDYFDHTVKATFGAAMSGYDMRRNMSVAWDAAGRYSTDLFTEEAVRLVRDHPKDSPLFLYLAHLAPHTGNRDNPFQALDEDVAHFGHIADPERRVYAAMIRRLDQGVGEVVAALRERDMLQDSIILFMSDNGAPTFGVHSNRGSNFPLRGMKESPWEGGVRGVAALWSPLLDKPGRVSGALMHVSDWLPTLLSAAGANASSLPLLDGVDQWAALSRGAPTRRLEVLHNIDDIVKYAALRRGDWKYVTGSTQDGVADHWFGEKGRDAANPPYPLDAVLHSKTGVALAGLGATLQIKGTAPEGYQPLSASTALRLRAEAEVQCPDLADKEAVACNPMEAPCLFNIRADPCERVNLAAARPQVLQSLEEALGRYRRTMLPPRNVPTDPLADPAHWNGTWTNWCSEQDDVDLGALGERDDDGRAVAPLFAATPGLGVSTFTAMSLATVAAVLAASLANPSAFTAFTAASLAPWVQRLKAQPAQPQ
ncbi:arylsulfatase B-like [Thrips palmi]|uniref:Arylsulfatase B-like n=1 Tax=Thrips palmi TaxID=161013 RepID=A0A6P9A1Y9_THRPL|nr:arylsulfatase B-like [Thrips palmi]